MPPGAGDCPRCGNATSDPDIAALDDLRGRILAVDAELSELFTRRAALVNDYEGRRFAILRRAAPVGPPGLAPPDRPEWSGARVRALLLWLGAALLGISAITFTAVAWSRLGDGGRAALLIGATAAIAGLALALRHRLPVTAEAFTGLAIVFLLVDVHALRRAGVAAGMPWQLWWALGVVAVAGCAAGLGRLVGRRTTRFALAALLPVAVQLLAGYADSRWIPATTVVILAVLAAGIVYLRGRSAGHLHREAAAVLTLHAAGSWLAAAVLAAFAAAQPDTLAAALAPALAVASLAGAPMLASRKPTDARIPVAALAAGVPAGMMLTLLGPLLTDDGMLTAAVIAGAATIAASVLLPTGLRAAAVIAGAVFALPGTLWAVTISAPAVLGPLAWLGEPWSATLDAPARAVFEGPATGPALSGSWAAVGALAAVGTVAAIIGIGRPVLLGIASAAIGLLAALAPPTAGASVLVTLSATTAVVVLGLLGGAVLERRGAAAGWVLLPGAAIAAAPTIGWAAISPAASVVTLAIATVASGAAAVIARGAARAAYAGLAALLGVSFVGVAAHAAGAATPAAGFAAALAAGVVTLTGVYLLRAEPVAAAVLEGTAALAALTGAAVAASYSTTWLAGTLSALVPIAAVAALSPGRRIRYGIAAGILALGAVWAWLASARVDVVEAYTGPAALAALAAGIIGWRRGPGRSWLTLGPALVLAIGPTLALGVVDGDAVRVAVAVALALAAVIAGAVRRLQAPLCLGAAALIVIGLDQWGADLVRMPRWITLGAAGVLLMWIGATFEHRRRDWRRAAEVIGNFG